MTVKDGSRADRTNKGDPKDTCSSNFPIVGIGSSAGGLKALETFFAHLPMDGDMKMAFVLVQHLHPDHKSILCELLERYTELKVYEVKDGLEVLPQTIYTAPPGRDITIRQGKLCLHRVSPTRGVRLPIDTFFRSLAEDRKEQAICIVLSGSGTDGTLGLKAIKGEGGMAMVQDTDTAEHKSMPLSAIATGMSDYVLPPEEMPLQLMSYVHHSFRKSLTAEKPLPTTAAQTLQDILALIHSHTGHDFSGYKENTLTRRIERRMSVHMIASFEDYYHYLQQTPLEVGNLFQELLVGVTRFFRDPEAFDALKEKVVPTVFDYKEQGDAVRIWVPGCSTGEEAYTLAILFHEHMEKAKKPCKLQVLATDLDSRSIEYARGGVYPENITADLSPGHLRRYFTRVQDGYYEIKKEIRNLLIFAEQNLTRDPSFSRLDLISCRNILIYMNSDLQKRVLQLFHYALNPEGFLFLGYSETTGDLMDLYGTVDSKWKIYQRKGTFHFHQALKSHAIPPMYKTPLRSQAGKKGESSIREVVEKALLQRHSPACVLVSSRGEILYIHGRTGKYLEPAQGEVNLKIVDMVRDGLKMELITALRKAALHKEPSRFRGLKVSGNGTDPYVNMTVMPFSEELPEAIMVLFEDVEAPQPQEVGEETAATSQDTEISRVLALEKELQAKEEYLQTVIEELETTNEELQSVNEEFQSTNEELETSKEELQSINEELMTVNAELQRKIDALSTSNNDMHNMLAGTGVGSVFIDNQLRIKRFTPPATQVAHLIPSDLGRPVSHISLNLHHYSSLTEDIQDVLDTLISKEIEVNTKEGKWYLMRILPYRTLNNAIEGAVVNFIDITERKHLQSRLAAVVRDARDAVIMQDFSGRILAWNPGAEKLYGWREEEALSMNIRDTVPKNHRDQALDVLKRLAASETLKSYRAEKVTKKGQKIEVWITVTVLVNQAGEPYAISTTERNAN